MSTHKENWDEASSVVSEKMRAWLNEGTQAIFEKSKDTSNSPKVLFVLDNDYGELTTLLYLITGQNYFHNSKLLLSPRVYKKNKNILPQAIDQWSSEEDLIQEITLFQPEIIVVAAAYLIPVHNLLSNEALKRVCQFASSQNCEIITADPFLALLSEWSPQGLEHIISIDIPVGSSKELAILKKSADKRLHTELSAVNAFMRNHVHLYPTYNDMSSIRSFPTDEKNRSFFNEKLCIPDYLLQESNDEPHWMFIISEVDFQTQSMHYGAEIFSDLVCHKLKLGASLGRRMIFLGPTMLIDILRYKLEQSTENIFLFNFGSYDRVMSLLLTAEYSFYWNVVSHTILIQLWNGKPPVLFDKGHLARSVTGLYERVIAWYYQGWEPPYFDQTKELSLENLENFFSDYQDQKQGLMEAYKRAPSPKELFDSLIKDNKAG